MPIKCAMCSEMVAVEDSSKFLGSTYCEKCIKIAKSQRAKALAKRREEKKYSFADYRRVIEAGGLDTFAVNVMTSIKLKRNEKLYFLGGDISRNPKISLVASNQRLFFTSGDYDYDYKIPPILRSIHDSSDYLNIEEGLVAKPLSSVIAIDPPFYRAGRKLTRDREFPDTVCVGLHFSNGKVTLLNFDSIPPSLRFYTILSELVDRVNDPIQEERLAPDRQRIPDEVKIAVWRRDGGSCVKCSSRENLEFDHIIPVSKGGSNTTRNIELLCEECNRRKSDSI